MIRYAISGSRPVTDYKNCSPSDCRFKAGDILTVPVIVASLGNFVDVYDLVLFSIVRITSLKSIGFSGQELLDHGVFLLNIQMAGLLIGGILWGIFGDKKGRMKILFGSIFLYSVANIANGTVASLHAYAFWRFIAGIGLAGELGAGVTLVAEILPRGSRGYGAMVIAAVGFAGAILANTIAERFDWRVAYYIGGVLGLMLLVLRAGVIESSMFKQMEGMNVHKGAFLKLFTSRARFFRYMKTILIGMPLWYGAGLLITLSPEFARELGITGPVSAGKAVMFGYFGGLVGDCVCGFLSQRLRSRKKAVCAFMSLNLFFIAVYFSLQNSSVETFYVVCWALGFASGYWAVLIIIAAEQFGTNLRATVATTVPNFVRSAVIPIMFLFQFIKKDLGILYGGALVGAVCLCISFYALYRLEETFNRDMNFIEE
ncbi:MAG: MFS transporter [Nitrospirae bacterium]|nr:MAG: MFS transporter [Nitrospirota bacterium]